MIEWIDRLLLSVSRDTMDVVAMVLTAVAVVYLAALVARVGWSIGRRDDVTDKRDE